MITARLQGRRFAWLMAGAAIALAVTLVVLLLVPTATPVPLTVALCLLSGAALGLVPGVRELEVTGARSMLGVETPLPLPRHPRARHRLRLAAWVLAHLAGGLLVAVMLVMALPIAVVAIFEGVTGDPFVLGTGLPLHAAGRGLRLVFGALLAVASLLSWWPIGAFLARTAVRFLGPTAQDRLALAESRAAQEAERNRIARELHDGIGHALTIVGIQAAAARRIRHRDPEAAAEALGTIERTAREATGELDAVLAVLRDEQTLEGTGRTQEEAPAGPLELDEMIRAHREAGLEVETRIDPAIRSLRVAAPSRRQLGRIVAELLSNAHRHRDGGPVHLRASVSDPDVVIEVTNRAGASAARRGSGRGLLGLRERTALLGGTLEAGPAEGDGRTWTARAILPILVGDHDGRRDEDDHPEEPG